MAKESVKYEINLDANSAQRALKGVRGKVAGLEGDLKKAAIAWASFAGAAKALELTKQAARFDDMKVAFDKAGGSLEKLREQTQGLVSDFELVQKANLARTMGINQRSFAEFAKIAQAAAKVTGQDMKFMFDSIITGSARQSKLILDNLGIIVSVKEANEKYAASLGRTVAQLSDAEKKQAFFNEVIEKGQSLIGAAGESGSLNDQLMQMSASLDNVTLAVGDLLKQGIVGLREEFGFWIDLVKDIKALMITGGTTLPELRESLASEFKQLENIESLRGIILSNFAGGVTSAESTKKSLDQADDRIAAIKKEIRANLGLIHTLEKRTKAEAAVVGDSKTGGGKGGKGGRRRGSVMFGDASEVTFGAFEGGEQMRKDIELFRAIARAGQEGLIDEHRRALRAREDAEHESMQRRGQAHNRFLEEQAEAEARASAKTQAMFDRAWGSVAQATLSGFSSTAIGLIDGLADGQEKAFERAAVSFLRSTGTQLMGLGIQYGFQGAGMVLSGTNVPGGLALAGLGVGAFTAGAAMGGTGAALGNSLGIGSNGQGGDIGTRTPRSGGGLGSSAASSGNQGSGPVTINVNYGVGGFRPEDVALGVREAVAVGKRRGIDVLGAL